MPQIYVACLASYNAGKLHGAWIDANQDASDIQSEIDAMLATSPTPGAEEWAIHDTEDFGSIRISENPDLDEVSLHGRMIEEHDGAWIAFVDHYGEGSATEEGFRDSYAGEYPSAEDYAEELARDCGYLDNDDKNPLLNYVDWERFVRDLGYDGYHFADSPSGVYVFRSW